jgi:hypothetical protein
MRARLPRDESKNPPAFDDRYLRGLFTAGALAVIRYAKIHGPRSAGMNISKRRVQLVNWQAEGMIMSSFKYWRICTWVISNDA